MTARRNRERIDTAIPAALLAGIAALLPGGCLSTHVIDVASTPIERTELVENDGARLYLQVRGEDDRSPLLLWLHGGPGGPERPLFRYFNDELEEHFVVAYWDQRGAGRSFDPDADPHRLTIRQHLADLDAVVERLRRSLGRDRIVLIGHSWGGALGLLYLKAHPEKVYALIGVAPLVRTRESQESQYEFVLDEACRLRDDEVRKRLREIGRPPHETVTQALAMESLAGRYGAVFHRKPNRIRILLHGMLRGLVTPWEIPRFIHGNEVSLKAMNDELLGLDLLRSVPSVDLPVFFFLGRYDRHVDSRIAARYLEALRAPAKETIWFESSAHNVPFEEPARFNAEIVRALRSICIRPAINPPRWPMADATRPVTRERLAGSIYGLSSRR